MTDVDWVRLAPSTALPRGTAVNVDIDGEQVALFHSDDGFHALAEACPHMGAPLSQGEIHGGQVKCPWHGWRYDLATGMRQDRRGQPARVYPVAVHDGWLSLGLPRRKEPA
ncbi:Rieske (2Fe-2S) protein [Nonomuraea sp. NPDC050202]|jgi:nitrite reductase/ring-hydroxylating ferredoxin subunit|uniref:Rieske (2Fe-2S) protein n=1 Tax=unclassified Nonomuraea TaxID=2593643 RepID=UPI003401AF9D